MLINSCWKVAGGGRQAEEAWGWDCSRVSRRSDGGRGPTGDCLSQPLTGPESQRWVVDQTGNPSRSGEGRADGFCAPLGGWRRHEQQSCRRKGRSRSRQIAFGQPAAPSSRSQLPRPAGCQGAASVRLVRDADAVGGRSLRALRSGVLQSGFRDAGRRGAPAGFDIR